ncbi:uncharacterized protein BJX67DRAFT_383432 [Aspergillus lucknowensis]|uniref:Uncharacterized protein n=1 Tax=Aspergillus lucknowensis TaxID=176173 RepID=A0ABR4LJT6_9EURO
MHFPKLIALTSALASVSLSTSTTSSSLPEDCMSIEPLVRDKSTRLIDQFEAIVCKRGCRPSMDQYESWGKEGIVEPLIRAVLRKMEPEIPSSAGARMVELVSTRVAVATKRQCGEVLLQNDNDICRDRGTLDSFAGCLKDKVLPVLLSELERYSFLITESMCEKAARYLEGPDLWENVIPGAFAEYADGCTG